MSNLIELETDKSVLQQQVVDLLKSMLERAEAGEFEGLALVAIGADNDGYTFNWTGFQSGIEIVGLLEVLKIKLLQDSDDADED